MQYKRWKTATFLLIVMLFIASACSSKNNADGNSASPDNSASASASESPSATASESAAPQDGPLAKYDPPIEITTVKASDTNTKYLPDESAEDNVWTKGYLNELGIKVKYDWIAAPGDEYSQKLNVTIASGELPDFLTVNSTQLKQLVEAGMIEDLTGFYNQYVSDLTREIVEGNNGIPLKSATFDGKIMGIPYVNPPIDTAPLLWVRMDWLKKVNLPEPQTMADVLKIAEAFTTGDPDGNGKPDTVGLALRKELYSGGFAELPGFFTGYHAYPKQWVKDASGNLVNGSTLPEYKNALAALQNMYKAGQLDKEFGVKGGPELVEAFVSGKAGLNFGAMWNPLHPFLDLKKKDPNAEWKSYPIPSIDGEPAKPIVGAGVGTFHVVRKGAKNPEALIKMTNFFVEKGFGESAQQEVYFRNSGIEIFGHAHFVTWPQKNLRIHHSIKDAFASGDASKLNPEEKNNYDLIKKFEATGDPEGWAYDRVFGPEGAFKSLDGYLSGDLLQFNQYYGLPTKTMVERGATLDKMEIEMATKIIMGASLDEFDKFVEDWKKLGGETITQEVNEWYKTKQ